MTVRHPRRLTAITVALGTAASLLATPAAVATPAGDNVVINEVYGGGGNSGSVFANDFVELYNPTDADIDVTGWVIDQQSAAGNTGTAHTLAGVVPAKSTYLVQGAAGNNATGALPTPDETGTFNFSGTQAVAELRDSDGDVVDLLGWGGASKYETAPAAGTSNSTSVARVTAGVDTDDNSVDFAVGAPTPASTRGDGSGDNSGAETPPATAEKLTVSQTQGTGAATPYAGRQVTTEGVVTAVYDEGGMNGYVIQEPGTGAEEPTASPAIFVYVGAAGAYPAVGDSVVVTGTAEEYYSVTQLGSASFTLADAPFSPVTPLEIDTLPVGDEAREAYEHMLVLPTGEHTVTNNYALNSYGEIGLAPGAEALRTPTDVVLPGEEAVALQAENDARLITLDDGRTRNYGRTDQSTPLPYLAVDGGVHQSIRTGDAVTFQNPVIVDFDYGLWRFQPTQPITGNNSAADLPITWTESRTAELGAMDAVEGEYSVASFNVLNYFTSLGQDEDGCRAYTDMYGTPVGTNYCTVRGAFTEAAFTDQQTKIVAAINGLNVDVLGLKEIENTYALTGDIERRDESLAALVDALNADAGHERWAYVESPAEVGEDEDVIRVGFIYDPSTVAPVGESRVFNDPAYTGDARQPLAQEFEAVDGSGTFVAVTNHFKSKGSVARGDADTGDGQGNNASLRTAQSQALLDALDAQDDWSETPIFILGDLNAYTREDAARVLEANGYTNINVSHAGSDPTYQFDGQLGSLDHAFGNEEAMALVQDARVWNINADEPIAYEYSRRNYNTVDFFDATPFRSSDHDPIKVGFTLAGEPGVEEPVNPNAGENASPRGSATLGSSQRR